MSESIKRKIYWSAIIILFIILIIQIIQIYSIKEIETKDNNQNSYSLNIKNALLEKDSENADLYLYEENLKIFNNSFYSDSATIAPGVFDTYNFVINNDSNIKLNYYFKMTESSEYKINLKYRLKKNGKYIIGDEDNWVSALLLKTDFSTINIGAVDNYSLDWKWEFDDGLDDEDSYVGTNMTSEYKLLMKIYFEQV